MGDKGIDSFSISDLFWTQFKKNRISFSFKGLADSVHFTIAWNNETGKMNLHITKNLGDGTNKPKFVIAYFNKDFLDELMSFAPATIFNYIFQPVSFKRYSRKSRKNIRLMYLDELETDNNYSSIKNELTSKWNQQSQVKRNRFKIRKGFEKAFIPIIHTKPIRSFLQNNIRNLSGRSFNSKSIRGGILVIGKKAFPFISSNGKCYAMTKRMTIYELLTTFSNPEFARSLVEYINEALLRLPDAQSLADTEPFNRPFTLFIEKAG